MTETPPTDQKLWIFFHNVQGLNSPVKSCKIKQQDHTLNADVVLLQETHFPATYNPSFLHKTFTQFHFANAVNKTRGVAVCFFNRVHFSPTKIIKDPEGCYVLVTGIINRGTYMFVSYYAPNTHQDKFFETVLQTLKPHFLVTVILGGDTNTTLTSLRTSPTPVPKSQETPRTKSASSADHTDTWPG